MDVDVAGCFGCDGFLGFDMWVELRVILQIPADRFERSGIGQ